MLIYKTSLKYYNYDKASCCFLELLLAFLL